MGAGGGEEERDDTNKLFLTGEAAFIRRERRGEGEGSGTGERVLFRTLERKHPREWLISTFSRWDECV